MSYQQYTWKSGDEITTTRLNNIQNGIANSGVYIISEESSEERLVKIPITYNEIIELINNNIIVVIIENNNNVISLFYLTTIGVTSIDEYVSIYAVVFSGKDRSKDYTAFSSNEQFSTIGGTIK